MISVDNFEMVAPALNKYTQERVLGDLWKQRGLSARDRSMVTLAVLITRNQTHDMPFYLGVALDGGVKPAEVSEIITHLAFYSGWGNAMAAISVAKVAFASRGITAAQLPKASPKLLPLNQAGDDKRAAALEQQYGLLAPGLLRMTTAAVFRDLWLRPDLAPRDRSLITVSSLVASGQVAQIPFHLNRAMDNGLTKAEASEVFTQLAFYAGWPNVFTALPVLKDVLEKRQ